MNSMEILEKKEKEEINFYRDFWKHYIELEKLFLETEKYVAIDNSNRKTYSLQYSILLQAICGEIDVVIKRFIYEYDNHIVVKNMEDYVSFLYNHNTGLENEVAFLDDYNLDFQPWKSIGFRNVNGENRLICPKWWSEYNSIKHRRITFEKQNNEFKIIEKNIKHANQENVLNALAALFILEKQCLILMRKRFNDLLSQINSQDSVEITNRFNDSIFQNVIETITVI